MIKRIFNIVALSLLKTAKALHTTYNAVNIIVFYLIIPLTWTILLDFKIGMPVFTALLLAIWTGLLIYTRHHFLEWCDMAFRKSQQFLLSFKWLGWDYIVSSVIICVLVPILIYLILILI